MKDREFKSIIKDADITLSATYPDGNMRESRFCEDILFEKKEDYLHFEPQEEITVGSMVDIHTCQRVDIYLKNGEFIYDAVIKSYSFQSNYAHQSPHFTQGETVDCFLSRNYLTLDDIEKMVIVVTGYNIVDHESMPEYIITIAT